MRREEFLSQFWHPYPEAPQGCLSLNRWAAKGRNSRVWLGGILSWESQGKAEGGDLLLCAADQTLRLQWQLPFLFCRAEGALAVPIAQMAVSHILQPGDQVAVFIEDLKGEGEVAKVSKLILLTPSLKERPQLASSYVQKWHGFLQTIRNTMRQLGLEEIATPYLVPCPGLEPSLEPFATEFKMGKSRIQFYLPTSPEIQLKRALTLGLSDVFEIKTCFRNGEVSEHHQPEFHMLEWYRGYANLISIEDDLKELLKSLGISEIIKTTTFSQLFSEYFQFNLTSKTTRGELAGLAADLKIETLDSDSWNDIFHRIMLEKLEPNFKSDGPLLIKNFPPSMAALARINGEGWADRFEFYWRGFEIANAFHEVNDPKEQEKRWQMELEERTHLGTSKVPTDPLLIEHFKMGFPPTGGIALGLERLFMAIHNIETIDETRLFPITPKDCR